MTTPVTIDFETHAIESRPNYPPEPVGVAIRHQNGKMEYLGWGHPEGNNSTRGAALEVLDRYWNSDAPLLFHNAKFDYAVATERLGLPELPWNRIRDTMIELYLHNPHARDLHLKESAERLLGLPPGERDLLEEWIYANIPGITKRKNPPGAHIAEAPGGLVGDYAIGDVDRTFRLHLYLENEMLQMQQAYHRELELLPTLLRMEQRGVRVDRDALLRDLEIYDAAWDRINNELLDIFGDINLNSGDQLARELLIKGYVDELPTTPTGKFQTGIEVLQANIKPVHSKIIAMLKYRSTLKTCRGTFLRPWEQLSAADGRLHTSWHQVRNPEGKGTRTGRIASSGPNLTNVPNVFGSALGGSSGYPPLPRLRKYLLPEEGHKWLKRDYSAQEIRVAAHFEDDELMRQFQQDPEFDPHEMAAEKIRQQSGLSVSRGTAKAVAFSLIYGTGIPGLANRLDVAPDVASNIKAAYLQAMPGLRTLMDDVKRVGSRGEAVTTTGGRLLRAEPPKDGRSFAYKLLNHLVQGSSADITKEAMINYDADADQGHLLVQVYDEINISAPICAADSEMEILRDSMERVPLDVPLLSEGYTGDNWLQADKT